MEQLTIESLRTKEDRLVAVARFAEELNEKWNNEFCAELKRVFSLPEDHLMFENLYVTVRHDASKVNLVKSIDYEPAQLLIATRPSLRIMDWDRNCGSLLGKAGLWRAYDSLVSQVMSRVLTLAEVTQTVPSEFLNMRRNEALKEIDTSVFKGFAKFSPIRAELEVTPGRVYLTCHLVLEDLYAAKP